jgi:ATP-dependent Clp protease ATP-binding subunit ClpC
VNGYNFTENARRTLAMAREEAVRLRHEYVGTEHLLLGLLLQRDGVAARVLRELGIDAARIQQRVAETIQPGSTARTTGPDLPYTSRSKAVLDLAMKHARELHHTYVGTEHLLIGMLAEGMGVAAQALGEAGLTLDRVREETVRVLRSPVEAPSDRTPWPARAGEKPEPSLFVVEVRYDGGWIHRREFRSVEDAVAFLQSQ